MTISSETRTAGPYTGNDITTEFAFAFKVFDTDEVLVVQTTDAGVESTLTETTHYTVALNADQDTSPGGTVTTVAALTQDYLLTLTSDVDKTQETEVTNRGGFYPTVFNDVHDKLVILIQQVSNLVDRSVKIPLSDGALTTELTTATLRADKALVFDSSGNIGVSTEDFDDQGATNAAASAAAAALSETAAETAETNAETAETNAETALAALTAPAVNVITSAANAITVDIDDGYVFSHTFTEDTTFTFSNPAVSGKLTSFKLFLTNDGTGRTPTWPGSVVWSNGSEPDVSTISEKNVLVFDTIDGGTIWYGALCVEAAA